MPACHSAAPPVVPGLWYPNRKFYIDPDGCIDCGSCETTCPNAAIFRADQLPTEWADFARVDATWYRDPAAARAVVDGLAPVA